MKRNLLAAILFLVLTTALVTAPTILDIQDKKQQIQGSMMTIQSHSQIKKSKMSAKGLNLEIQNLAEESSLSQNMLTMQSIGSGSTDTCEFDLDYSGTYENLCRFTDNLQEMEGALISHVTIDKPKEKEKALSQNYRVRLQVAFTGVS